MLKTVFSFIGGLFKTREAETPEPGITPAIPPNKKAPAPETVAVKPTPPQKKPPVKDKTPAPPKETPSPAPPVKRKKVKKTPKPKHDKKGFRIIDNRDDLAHLFGAPPDKKNPDEDFSKLLEKSMTDTYQRRMLHEKAADVSNRPKTVPAAERIKSYPPPQEDLDLHGYTASQAMELTEKFVRKARLDGRRTVRIIVGKGLHSDGKAVLPDVVEGKLIQLKRHGFVLAYKWEKKDKRKSGAVIVYL